MAQLAEQLICNQQVNGSSPFIGLLWLLKVIIKYGWIPEWPKGTDCKSAANCFGGSNPPPPIHLSNIRCKKLPERPVFFFAGVAELADAQDLKSCGGDIVPVRFRSPALTSLRS